APLQSLRARHGCTRLAIAGDLFEDAWCPALGEELLGWLDRHGLELAAVVPGNHDRGLPAAGAGLPIYAEGVELGRWRVVHGDGILPAEGLVYGHFHPWLRWGRISVPCYLVSAD